MGPICTEAVILDETEGGSGWLFRGEMGDALREADGGVVVVGETPGSARGGSRNRGAG
jgi:hypothetical protein